ncbi:response regulator [Larkinella bovis]|uniref:Response regulator n=1 Tax=Larkinella bovis TaxID=683041 RepID=A0ABW0IJS8_9BACT
MKVLVVDDETDVQVLFEQRFRREIRAGEFQFAFAHSGEKAMDYLNQQSSEYILILSDINMPGMSGLELLQKIRTIYPTSPPTVMMITAYGDADSYNQAMQLGADAFLTKPLDFTNLKEKLKSAL